AASWGIQRPRIEDQETRNPQWYNGRSGFGRGSSRNPQHRGPFYLAVLELLQGQVGLLQLEYFDLCVHRHLGGQLQKVEGVSAGAVRHTTQDFLVVDGSITKLRDRTHCDACQGHRSPSPDSAQRCYGQLSSGRKDNGCIQFVWRFFVTSAYPGCT